MSVCVFRAHAFKLSVSFKLTFVYKLVWNICEF